MLLAPRSHYNDYQLRQRVIYKTAQITYKTLKTGQLVKTSVGVLQSIQSKPQVNGCRWLQDSETADLHSHHPVIEFRHRKHPSSQKHSSSSWKTVAAALIMTTQINQSIKKRICIARPTNSGQRRLTIKR